MPPESAEEARAYRQAEEIVARARTTKALVLDLSGLRALTTLPDFSGLDFVTKLKLQFLYLHTLKGIEALKNLRTLDASFCRAKNFSAIGKLAGLEVLDLSDSGISDLTPVSRLKNLRVLSLAFAPISDIPKLAGVERLQSLNIRNTSVADLTPIAEMHSLLALNISHSMVADLSPLAHSENLIVGARTVGPKYDRHTFGGLRFTGCPLLDLRIQELSSLPKFARTLSTINFVRQQLHLEPYTDYGDYVVPLDNLAPPDEPLGLAAAPDLPEQSAGPRFEISPTGVVKGTHPSLHQEGNDVDRLTRLLPPLREAVFELVQMLSGPGSNSHPHVLKRAEIYKGLITLGLESIDFAQLYAAGLRLENAKFAAERDIKDGISPPLEDEQFEALKSAVTLHGIFVLSSADGQALTAAAERMDMTSAEVEATTNDILEVLKPLGDHSELVDSISTATIIEVASDNAPMRHPARRTAYTYAATSNLLIVLGGYAILGWLTGGTVIGVGELAAGTAIHSTLTQRGSQARYFATVLVSDLADFADKHLQETLRKGGENARTFLLNHEDVLRRLANRSPRFTFLNGVLDWLSDRKK